MADYWGNYASGLNAIKGFGELQTRQRAGSALAAGRPADAANEMFRSGDITAGREIQTNARTTQAADRATQLAVAGRVTTALRGVVERGEDLPAALAAARPSLLALGTDERELAALERRIIADPKFLGTLTEILDAEATETSVVAGGGGDQVVMRVNKRSGNSTAQLGYIAERPDQVSQFGVVESPDRGLAPGQAPTPLQAAQGRGQPQAPVGGMAGPPIGPNPLWGGPTTSVDGDTVPPPPVAPSAMVGITAQSESGNRERDARGNLVTSPAGAQGRMQVMPTTNTDPGYGVRPARDNSDAERTRVGEDYLAAMMQEYGGDPAKAWAAYNWGPGNLNRAIQRHGGDWFRHAPAETRNYVAKNLMQLEQQGGIAQGDDNMDPPIGGDGGASGGGGGQDTVTTANGYRITRFTNPADARADRADERAEQSARLAAAAAAREAARFNERNAPSQADARADRRVVIQEQQRLNTEFNNIPVVKRFKNTEAEYADVMALARARGGVNSVALTYAIMKMAAGDGSVVRESEFALIGTSAGIPEGTIALMQRAANGDALTPEQRSQIESVAETLYHTRRAEYNREAARFRRFAVESEANPDRVAPVANNPNGRGTTRSPVRGVPAPLWNTSSPAQQDYWRANPPRGPQGSATNPLRINPQEFQTSYGNVRVGQHYLDPDGNPRQRLAPGGRRR